MIRDFDSVLELLLALSRPAALLELGLLALCLGLAWAAAVRWRPRHVEAGIWFGDRGFDGLLFPLLALALALLARWLMRGHGPVFQLAVPVLAGSAAYAVGEVRGWKTGLESRPREALPFYSVICASIGIGLVVDFLPLDPIKALIWSAVLNGVIVVPIIGAMMIVASRREIMGDFTATLSQRVLGWLTLALMASAATAMFVLM